MPKKRTPPTTHSTSSPCSQTAMLFYDIPSRPCQPRRQERSRARDPEATKECPADACQEYVRESVLDDSVFSVSVHPSGPGNVIRSWPS